MKRNRPSHAAVAQASRSGASPSGFRGLRGFLLALLIALCAARPLLPSEGAAALGDGQPFDLMWLLLAAAVFFDALRKGDLKLRWTAADLALVALVACNVTSALASAQFGNPRAAVNMTWEWIAVGASYFLVRILVAGERDIRAVVAVMISIAVVVSADGYYQHFAGLRNDRTFYQHDPEAALAELGLSPVMGSPDRALFESRLFSDEVFATFGLANSLAGFLAAWLVVALGAGIYPFGRGRARVGSAALLAAAVVLAGCLALTKSRSALLATAVGIGLIGLSAFMARRRANWKIIGGTAALLAALIGGAVAVKARNAPLLSDAGKSLGYRLQYWQATLEMIRDYPWLGVGPGSFQDYYTRYKLPTASEEVSDPHNFLFEVWATAGTPAAIALLVLLGCWGWTILRSAKPGWEVPDERGDATRHDDEQRTVDLTYPFIAMASAAGSLSIAFMLAALSGFAMPGWLVLVGFLLVVGILAVFYGCILMIVMAIAAAGSLLIAFLLGPLTGFSVSDPTLVSEFLLVSALLAASYRWILRGRLPRLLPAIAVVVLLVHLSAAGGIAFPAVAGSLWLCLALSLNLAAASRPKTEQPQAAGEARFLAAAGLIAALVAAGACFASGYLPVLKSFAALQRAAEQHHLGAMAEYERALDEAIGADPLALEPWQQLARRNLESWIARPTAQKRAAFEDVMKRALDLRPQASAVWREAGQLHLEIFNNNHEPNDARQAAEDYNRATVLYPNNAAIRAEYAIALDAADDKPAAGREAAEALRLDAITPHSDKKLSPEIRERMTAIVGGK